MQQTARGKDDRSKDQRSEPQAGALPNQAFDLRSTLEWLRASGELIETDKEVDPDLQVTGLQKHMDGGCPVLFNNVKGKPNHRVITNLFGDMAIINRMFGWKDDAERVRKLAYALSHPIPPVEISQNEAPCQEHVIESPRDVNEWMVPIRHTTYEPELTVGSGIRCVTGPQFEGGMGIDATVPFGYESDFLRPVYPVDKVRPEDFFSKEDIANAKKRMQGWVHSLARSGR